MINSFQSFLRKKLDLLRSESTWNQKALFTSPHPLFIEQLIYAEVEFGSRDFFSNFHRNVEFGEAEY